MFGGTETGGGCVGSAGRSAAAGQKAVSIRGGSGLGDAIYLQAIARHLTRQGHRLEVCCDHRDVFLPLADAVTLSPFRRAPIDRLAHYAALRHRSGTTQFEDGCIQAGIREKVELRIDWKPRNLSLVEHLRGASKPVIVLQQARAPFGRSDGFGLEFAPDWRVIQKVIDRIGSRCFFVQIGKGTAFHRYSGIDLDLTDRTSVADLLDIGFAADGFLGQCSFIIPLAESFVKPALLVWSRKGLQSPKLVIRQMTPQKILHRPSSRYVIDDFPDNEINRAADALCEQVGSQVTV